MGGQITPVLNKRQSTENVTPPGSSKANASDGSVDLALVVRERHTNEVTCLSYKGEQKIQEDYRAE